MRRNLPFLLILIFISTSIPAYAQLKGIEWNTFLGSANDDDGQDIAMDSAGNIYVVGKSDSTWGSPINAFSGGEDAFVAKLDSSGNLLWHTFLGSSTDDWGNGITINAAGNVMVIGRSYNTWGSPVSPCSGDDAFVACLNSSGTLLWNTFLGSSNVDQGVSIVTDSSGNIAALGRSYASWGTPVNPYSSSYDVFVAALDSSGNLIWHTFMEAYQGNDIILGNNGNILVTGYGSLTWGSPINPHSGQADAFVACLNSSGTLLWNTFLGSSNKDYGHGIASNSAGNIYICGYGYASWGTPTSPFNGGTDAFVAILDSSGNLLGNTFLGSSGADYAYGITLDDQDNICLVGVSGNSWGNPVNGHNYAFDAFAACLDNSGTLVWNTFMGGSITDWGRSMVSDGTGNFYVIGQSDTSWGTPISAFNGGEDTFVAKLTTHPLADIKANGSDGPISITNTDTLQIRVSLITYGKTDNVDFWLAYKSSAGWFHYNNTTKQWESGLGVTHQGPLQELNNKKVFQQSGLTLTDYTFYFGVDLNMDGKLTKSELHYDEVQVTVTPD